MGLSRETEIPCFSVHSFPCVIFLPSSDSTEMKRRGKKEKERREQSDENNEKNKTQELQLDICEL